LDEAAGFGIFDIVLSGKYSEGFDVVLSRCRHILDVTDDISSRCPQNICQAEYVGGHPLITESRPVLLSLSNNAVGIHAVSNWNLANSLATIPLENITKVSTGKPKTAREIYDEDRGTTIDVTEQSPYLSIAFSLEGDTFTATLQSLDADNTPQQWSNLIISKRYQLMHRAA
jgi:hypothetical protein